MVIKVGEGNVTNVGCGDDDGDGDEDEDDEDEDDDDDDGGGVVGGLLEVREDGGDPGEREEAMR